MKKILVLFAILIGFSFVKGPTKVSRLDFYNIENYDNGTVTSYLTMIEKGDLSSLNENLADTNVVNLEDIRTKCQIIPTRLEFNSAEKIKTVHQPGVNPNNNQFWIERTYYTTSESGFKYEYQVRIIMDRYYRIKNVLFFDNEKIVKRDVLLKH
jgi:hypothetical protein